MNSNSQQPTFVSIEQQTLAMGIPGSQLSWRAMFAGLLIALIAYFTLSALGAGIGGAAASNAVRTGGDAGVLAGGTLLWMVFSIFLSLAIGSYFAVRTSTLLTHRLSIAHGAVIAAMFFPILIYGTGRTIGAAGSGISSMMSSMGAGAANLASNPKVQVIVEDALGNANLRSDVGTVTQGLATRVLAGDLPAARNYLAYQTGLPAAEVEARFIVLRDRINQTATMIADQTARAVSSAGWVLFVLMVGGIASAAGGSALAVKANGRQSLTEEENSKHLFTRPALT